MSKERKTDSKLGEEDIFRPNVWQFYAYFAGKAIGVLDEFMEVADIEEKIGRYRKYSGVEPSKAIVRKDFKTFVRAFQKLIDFRNKVEDGDYTRINFWRGDVIGWLADALHQLVNILPYLNDRHFTLSEERYAAASRQYSLDELRNLD